MKSGEELVEVIQARLSLAAGTFSRLSPAARRRAVRRALRFGDQPSAVRRIASAYWHQHGDGTPPEALTLDSIEEMGSPEIRAAARATLVAGHCVYAHNVYALLSRLVGVRGDRLLRQTVKFDSYRSDRSSDSTYAATQHYWIVDPAIGPFDLTREQVGTIIPSTEGRPVTTRKYVARAFMHGSVQLQIGDWSPRWTYALLPLLARTMINLGVLAEREIQ